MFSSDYWLAKRMSTKLGVNDEATVSEYGLICMDFVHSSLLVVSSLSPELMISSSSYRLGQS